VKFKGLAVLGRSNAPSPRRSCAEFADGNGRALEEETDGSGAGYRARMARADFDVVVLGGGIAGAFLARHLKLEHPELSVLVLEAKSVIDDFKVGESTVEVAADYMIRRLGLSTYLYQHQLPKNGLRFFFDDADKKLPLASMSEIGSTRFPQVPSFQLERASLERDMVELNRAIGVDVRLGAKAGAIRIDARDRHRIAFEQGGETFEVSARWLVDASGRRQVLSRALGAKIHKETRLDTAAAWARYEGMAGLDAVVDPAWRRRVRWTSRHLSTNHMMYDGYWIWFIPLAGDRMSVGVVYDKSRVGEALGKREPFERFLEAHRSSRDLMQGAKLVDFQSFAHLPYYSDLYFSTDRWALTGEAGAFTDPFYSPGSDFIATANEFIVSMIESELAGEVAAFEKKAGAYNAYFRFKYELTIRLYAKLYPVFGSFEVFRLKFLLDFNNYYNVVVWPFMNDKLRDPDWILEDLRLADRVVEAQTNMADQLVAMADHLRARGEYFAQNEGRWADGLWGVSQFEKRLATPIDGEFRTRQLKACYASTFASILARITGEDVAEKEMLLTAIDFPTVTLMKRIDEASYGKLLGRIEQRIKKELLQAFPGAPLERVTLAKEDGDRERTPRALGALEPELQRAMNERAADMWVRRGDSLTHVTSD
jgi:flavin-dependent dehydrogenase